MKIAASLSLALLAGLPSRDAAEPPASAAPVPNESDVERRRGEIMDRVEASVRLPAGAAPLAGYGRYYLDRPDGTVLGVYVIGWSLPDPSWTCSDGYGRPVTCSRPRYWPTWLRAGQRRWVESERDIPTIFDGGCMVVAFTFDPRTGVFGTPHCNGVA